MFTVEGNCEYKETDSLDFVQSSMKYDLLWVTMYVFAVKFFIFYHGHTMSYV